MLDIVVKVLKYIIDIIIVIMNEWCCYQYCLFN